ncbi:acyl-CoA N-acyltransferase, partial [Xylariales sp. PMI_506]
TLSGCFVDLVPTTASHASSLYRALCISSKPSVFAYMAAGPFDDESSFASHISNLESSEDPFFFSVVLKQALPNAAMGTCVGYLSLMNIDTSHRSIEIGHVTLSEALQRTTAATETFYLAMQYCVETLGNRRLEWKCDALNAKSRRAAERLGFLYEGLFRKHRIMRGRNRDTTWFSMTDDEWWHQKPVFEAWLKPENFADGEQIRSLEQLREE